MTAVRKVPAKAVQQIKPRAAKVARSAKKPAVARAGSGFTDADMAEVMDFPELTDAELASAKPFAEVFPELAASIKRRGKQKAPTKAKINLRVDQAVLDHYKGGDRRRLAGAHERRLEEGRRTPDAALAPGHWWTTAA